MKQMNIDREWILSVLNANAGDMLKAEILNQTTGGSIKVKTSVLPLSKGVAEAAFNAAKVAKERDAGNVVQLKDVIPDGQTSAVTSKQNIGVTKEQHAERERGRVDRKAAINSKLAHERNFNVTPTGEFTIYGKVFVTKERAATLRGNTIATVKFNASKKEWMKARHPEHNNQVVYLKSDVMEGVKV